MVMNPPFPFLAGIATNFARLVGAVAYHLGCVARLRPDYERLSDSRANLWLFGVLTMVAATGRHVLAANNTVLMALLIGALHVVGYGLLWHRTHQSKAIVMAVWMASVNTDLLALVLWATGMSPGGSRWIFSVAEITMIVAATLRFREAPAHIRAAGYRQPSKP